MDKEQINREWMVEQQIAGRGVEDERVLEAMRKVPRHLFVPLHAKNDAYSDWPIRIGHSQTISQPYVVGLMSALLGVEAHHRVLDVGTGSGYQAAILGELAVEVHSIERFADLAESAEAVLNELGYKNVHIHIGDGTQGFVASAPYDRILVGASAPSVPEPLLEQLADNGRLVIPVGNRLSQKIEVWDKKEKGFSHSSSIPVIFVPLIGRHGWGQ